MSEDNEFSVYQFFPDGQYERLKTNVSAKEAVETAESYTRANRPAVMVGVIQRVIITDGGDNTVFEWKNGAGITWPAPFKKEATDDKIIPE